MTNDGTISWFKWIDGTKYDDAYLITLDLDDNIYITGNSESNSISINSNVYQRDNETYSIYLAKFNPEGNDLWCIWIAGDSSDEVSSISCDNYNYIYLIGYSNSKKIIINEIDYSKLYSDKVLYSPYLIKINTNGSVDWFKWVEGDQDVFSYALAIDKRNNVYITGNTTSEYLIIDDTKYNNKSTNDNGFLIKLFPNGDLDWHHWLFNEKKDDAYMYISNILIDENYNLYMSIISNFKNIYFNNDDIFLSNTNFNKTLIIKYNLNNIKFSDEDRNIIYILNNNYKILFYFLLFIIYIYVIWLLYINKII